MSYRVQELEIEDNEIKTVFSWQGTVRRKYIGKLSDSENIYLCRELSKSAFFNIPEYLEYGEIQASHRASLYLQISINGKEHTVVATNPSPEKELAALDLVWAVAFSKPWNDHMRVKAYSSKNLFGHEPQ